MRVFRVLAIVLLPTFCLTLPARLAAQAVTGTILGTATDASGARVADATVVATNALTDEKHTTKTNATGDYIVPALPVGTWRVEVEAQGFKRYVRQGIVLEVNQNARVDGSLEVGQTTQQVLVTGDAALVDTHEVQLGNVVNTREITELPLNGRNVYALVGMLPGVTGTSLQQQPDVAEGTQFNLNGSRVLSASFFLDGALNNNVFRDGGLMSPNPDAVEEFRLITSNYNAEYGRSAGGVVNVITRSGTNRFHGSLFEFLRNSDLNARSFFQPSVSDLKQNQFGGTLHGPVKKDKLFFLFSYQGTRQRSAQFVNAARTPTAVQRQGDFSGLPANQRPRDPDTNAPFANGIIPASRLDKVAVNIENALIPLPNTPDGRVQSSQSTSFDSNEILGKADYLFNTKHRMAFTTFNVTSNDIYPFSNQSASSNLPGYAPVASTPAQHNLTFNETWTASPTLLNQFTFSFTGSRNSVADLNTKGLPDFGAQITLAAQPVRPPNMTVTNGWTVGTPGGDLVENDHIYSWTDSLSWTRGAHSIKLGGLVQHFAFDWDGNGGAAGSITATGAFTGFAFSDFELGRVQFGAGSAFKPHLIMNDYALFAQDDWKVSRRLTLNLGLRYDLFGPFTSRLTQLSNWSQGQQSTRFPNAPLGMVFVGDAGVPDGLVPTRKLDFAPRVGLAYDLFGNGKTSIRTGYGIFYGVGFAGLYNANYGQPFSPSASVPMTTSLVNPYATLSAPFPPAANVFTFVLPLGVPWMNQNNVTPYVEQYNFTIQQQLGHSFALQAAYVGNVSRHLELQRDANAPIYQAGKSTVANVNQRRPYGAGLITTIPEAETSANASYNALQITLSRRFSHGLTLQSNYTYSKATDLQSATQQNTAVGFTDSYNLALDHGPANFDVRHVFNLSFVWESPRVRRWGVIGTQALSNWQINGIGRYASGRPFGITSGVDTNVDGVNNDRADLVGNPKLDTSRPRSQLIAQFFNPAAFRTPATGLDGTSGRNIIYGLGSSNWDLSFVKSFPIHESHRLQFRAEFFNLLNKPNFNNPQTTLSSPNVAQILGASAGRVVQFALKYMF
jgi:hypothetical protein